MFLGHPEEKDLKEITLDEFEDHLMKLITEKDPKRVTLDLHIDQCKSALHEFK